MENEPIKTEANTEEKKKVSPIPALIVIILLVVGFVSCCISGDQEKLRNARFESMVKDTLKDYRVAIDHYSISSSMVFIYVRDSTWNDADKETKESFIEEVTKRIQLDAYNSGMLEKMDTYVTFKKNDGTEIKSLTIKRP